MAEWLMFNVERGHPEQDTKVLVGQHAVLKQQLEHAAIGANELQSKLA